MKRRSFIQTAFAAIATAGISKSAAASAPRASVNGVPYPYDVRDMDTLQEWLASIKRPVKNSTGAWAIDQSQASHREIFERAIFRHDDGVSFTVAQTAVFQSIAQGIFAHLIGAPNGTIVWRVRPEEDISWELIPSDLSRIEERKQAEKRSGIIPTVVAAKTRRLYQDGLVPLETLKQNSEWHVDYLRDRLVHTDEPFGTWRYVNVYVRYSVVVDGVVV